MQLRHTDDLKVPAARIEDLVTTESKDEVLVYDQAVHHIHHLASRIPSYRLGEVLRAEDIAASVIESLNGAAPAVSSISVQAIATDVAANTASAVSAIAPRKNS